MKRPRILILGGSENQVPLINRAKALGYYVIVASNRLDVPGIALTDEYIQIECMNPDEIIATARRFDIGGIVTNSEPLFMAQSEAATALGLPCISPETTKLYKDKYLMREFCRGKGIKHPRFKECRWVEEAVAFFEEVGCKCIIKPLNNSASRGVFSINSVEDLLCHFDECRNSNLSSEKDVLIEEYITGTEFTVDSFVLNGKNYPLAISEKKHYPYNENVAYQLLFAHDNEKFDYDLLRKEITTLVESTDLKFGITHAEYKYQEGDFYLIEIQARGGGNFIATDIVPFISGIDPYNLLLRSSIGDDIKPSELMACQNSSSNCAVLYFFDATSSDGVVKKIHGLSYLDSLGDKLTYQLYFKEGDKVQKAANDAARIGYYILKCSDLNELTNIMNNIKDTVMIEIDWKKKIIDYIRRNRVCTTEVADCLGKSGVLPDVMPINQGQFRVGNIKWVYANAESNWDVHEQIIDTEEGDIVFIEAFDCKDRAIIGELVTKYIVLYRQATAIICNARFRDAAALLKEKYPVWCTGFTPVGCFNKKPAHNLDEEVKKEHFEKYNGAVAVCDDCGVVIIPKEHLTEDFYHKLENIEEQEDIWFNRLDHYKENTFEIVCLKKYLSDNK